MNPSWSSGPRPRVLVADADEARRRSLCETLSDEFSVAEAKSAEDALTWLSGRSPGLTLLDHGLPGAGGAELVARVRELFPNELVLILAPDPSLGVCRAAMRAGAYDCLDRHSLLPETLRAVCEAAAARLEETERANRAREERVAEAVRRHEREAAARLATSDVLDAWCAADPEERKKWADAWLRAAEAPDRSAEREKALAEILEGVAHLERPGAVLVALHAHVAAAQRPPSTDAPMDHARAVLVAALSRLADDLATRAATPSPASIPPAPVPAEPLQAADSGLAWHRFRLGGGIEEWDLVVAGRVLARVRMDPTGCRGFARTSASAERLAPLDLPPVPQALREVERRLGLPLVLDVKTAAVP